MSIPTSTAQNSLKLLNAEIFGLTPSTVVTLFEIDLTDIISNNSLSEFYHGSDKIFRFHNNAKLLRNNIYWGNPEYEYIAAPINAEGFAMTSQGTLETPKLSISVNDDGVPLLAVFKSMMSQLGDLSGAKVTRIRTMASNLNASNWDSLPLGFYPDPYREFTRDIYFIDRKSFENRSVIEFELASLFDIEGIKLPARIVLANRCVWTYRGPGCLYEMEANRNTAVHGVYSPNNKLPTSAPPVANEKDELIKDLLPVGSPAILYIGAWSKDHNYNISDYVYIEINNIKYYFVCKQANSNITPPNSAYWIADLCSHNCVGCKLRYGTTGAVSGTPFGAKGNLPMGSYPGCDKVR